MHVSSQAATCLSELDQSPPSTTVESMQPFLNAIVKPELLKHQDRDAKLLVATCICEITRITAPEAPYNDDVLKDVTPAARRLAMNVIEQCSGKLGAGIKQFLISLMSGDNHFVNSEFDYHEVIYDVYCCAPQILSGVVPYLTGELLTDQLDTRLRAVRLVGDLFALPGSTICEAFQPVFSEFLKRLTDRVVDVRMSVLEHVKNCLLSNPSRSEAAAIISALCDRLLDYDENVRKQVVAVISDVACHSLASVPVETIKLLAERLRDKSLLVKKFTMERLAEIFKVYCASCTDGSITTNEYDWIPGKIFRSDTIESILCGFLFPTGFSIKDKVKCWIRVFSGFDKIEVKALERMLEQKQRLQQEMQRYLSLRQMHQDTDAPDLQKKVLFGFRIMSRCFSDPMKAEESFQILDQLKDGNIWRILVNLLDPNASFHQASSGRDDLLKILGEKHRLYDFLSTLSLKCSYLLFNKEHVKEIFLEATVQKSTGNIQYTHSCMNILVILARFSPLLLGGAEEELVKFLKDDNEIIKEGILHVLAKAGGTIREQLAMSSRSIDLILERLCLEGSRRQAKYAVHALAAITKDDGLKSLSVLYKRLVDMLEEKTHLPAVLQSLGCIAQIAMPVFETRESDIEEFIKSKILRCSNKADTSAKECWDDKSELCLLKVFGLKTLVKSYLPGKDAHLRLGISNLLELLRNILSFGEISKEIESSSVDKAHLRLAAAKAVLRLSRYWDHKIPLDVFQLTLRTPEMISFPQAGKLFLRKEKQNLADIFQMYQQAKARLVSVQSDSNSSTAYPEYILPYLVHVLAHHSCPNTDECKDVKAFELIYRQLFVAISMLVNRDEDTKSEVGVNKEKQSISVIFSIFKSIKCSEDNVDATKLENSHAICDLGLSIMKCLAYKEEDLQGLMQSVSLPPLLYKPYERKEGEGSQAGERRTWLADETVLSHFESLKLESDGMVQQEISEGEAFKDSEIEGNDMPLRKMIKLLKSKGAKDGKAKRKKSLSAEAKDAKNDTDILKMAREINLSSREMSSRFESSNGHNHSPTKKEKLGQEHQKGKKRKTSGAASVPVPKHGRSLSAHTAFKISKSVTKVPSRDSGDDWHEVKDASFQSTEMDTDRIQDSKDQLPTQKVFNKNNGSDYLVSCFRKKRSVSSKGEGKGCDWGHSDVSDGDDDENLEKSAAGSRVKSKRSIAGLAKCTAKEDGIDIADLIGYRIKVLYDDGDVEVLRLERERWELVNAGRKSIKKAKSPKGSKGPLKERSPGQKSKSLGGSRQNKSSVKMVQRKRTPKRNLKHTQKSTLKSNADDEEAADLSKSTAALKMNSDQSEGEDTEMVDENLTDREESDKEVGSVSQERCSEDTKGSPNHSVEANEVKSDADSYLSEEADSSSKNAEKEDEEEKAANELASEVSTERDPTASKATEGEAKETEESDQIQTKSRVSKKSSKGLMSSSVDVDSGISDDEPLCKWKRKVGKSSSKKPVR
ncbi:Sister chromatid cohesion PDS5 B [Gossypium arboreum]|uniref:Sister chromatid cohesion PDS5 B n=1 Tax=Gossypium arboreum TaxID=29729 RepID=A0A0B0NCK2_GOSAR|nr:Sister chromatid cohesion PDS5 B [Gossypium arboreum]